MSRSNWTKSFDYLKPKEVRVGQVSPRRAAATYQQMEDQQEENKKRYKEPNGLHLKDRGENV